MWPLWKSVIIGVFIGTTFSSAVLFALRFVPITSLGMIVILYLYAFVGGITGYVVHKANEGNGKVIEVEKKDNPEKKADKKVDEEPEVFKVDYSRVNERIKEIRSTTKTVRDLVKTRGMIDEFRKEGNSIVVDSVGKLSGKAEKLTEKYQK